MLAAKRLNIFAIAVLTGRTSREELNSAGANQTVNNLSELSRLIRNFCKKDRQLLRE
jgi:phosphoglycolate phosphatase-like HAD superfamily hydrolase